MTRARRLILVPVLLLLASPAARAEEGPSRLSERLQAALGAGRAGDRHLVWVYLRDKGPAAGAAAARVAVTPRALSRRSLRARVDAAGAGLDVPVLRAYVEAVAARALRVRQVSRWFNAVSVEATADQVAALASLPFVERLDVVRRYRRGPEEPVVDAPAAARGQATPSARRSLAIDYGTSLGQLRQIDVPAVHDLGFHGEGVVIAVLDAGFNNLAHEVFAPMSIVARHDFVNGDDDVGDGSDRGEGSHGTMTLSVIGGYKDGQLVGPAFAASFILAKTEDTSRETPVEEDNWAAAAVDGTGTRASFSSVGQIGRAHV